MPKKANDYLVVKAVDLRRADRHLCKKIDLVEVEVIEEQGAIIFELLTYKDLETTALYVIQIGRAKNVQRYNNTPEVTLVRKNKK